MTTFNVQMPDGTIIEGVPEGTSQDDVMARYKKMNGKASGLSRIGADLYGAGEGVGNFVGGAVGALGRAVDSPGLTEFGEKTIPKAYGLASRPFGIPRALMGDTEMPTDEQKGNLDYQVAGGLGQAGAMAGTGAVSVPILMAGGASQALQKADEYEVTKGEDLSTGQRAAVGAAGAALAIPEYFANKVGIKGIPKGMLPEAVEKIATTFGGRAATGVAVEGAQEGAQQFAQNAADKIIYNDDQDLGEGVARSALVGGITGGLVGGASHALGGHEKAPTAPPEPSEEAKDVLSRLKVNEDGTVEAPGHKFASKEDFFSRFDDLKDSDHSDTIFGDVLKDRKKEADALTKDEDSKKWVEANVDDELADHQAELDDLQSALDATEDSTARSELNKQLTSSRKKYDAERIKLLNKYNVADSHRATAEKLRAEGKESAAQRLEALADKLDPKKGLQERFKVEQEKLRIQRERQEAGLPVENEHALEQAGKVGDEAVEANDEQGINNAIKSEYAKLDALQKSPEAPVGSSEDTNRAVYESPATKAPKPLAEALERGLSQKASRERGWSPKRFTENLVESDEKAKARQEEQAFSQNEQENANTFDGSNPLVDFKVAPGTPGVRKIIPISTVQSKVDSITSKWNNGPKVHVIRSMMDAPKEVQDEAIKQGVSADQIQGFHHKGEIYIHAPQMASENHVAEVLFHEAHHYGARGLFGQDYLSHLDTVAKSFPKEVEAKAKDYGFDYSTKEGKLRAADEHLAELAQTNPQHSLVRTAIAKIRQWLRNYFPDLKYSNSEIIEKFIIPSRKYVEGKPRNESRSQGTDGEAQFSLDKKLKESLSTLKDNGKEIGKESKVSLKDVVSAAKTLYQSASDNLINIGTKENMPIVKSLGEAINKRVVRQQQYSGAFNSAGYLDVINTIGSSKRRADLRKEHSQYRELMQMGKKKEALQLLASGDKDLAKVVRGIDKAFKLADDENKNAKLMVKDPASGRYKPYKGFDSNYFPLQLKHSYEQALREPGRYPEIATEIAKKLHDAHYEVNGHVVEPTVAGLKEYAAKNYVGDPQTSMFGNIERARTNPFPADMYDYDIERVSQYRDRWSNRLAQVDAYGQGVGSRTEEELDENGEPHLVNKWKDALDEANAHSQDLAKYIDSLREIEYNLIKRIQGMDTLNLIATGSQLANPKTVLLNLLGGMGFNAAVFPAKANGRALMDMMKGDLFTTNRTHVNEAFRLGLLKDDYSGMLREADQLGVSRHISNATAYLMHKTGYLEAEKLTRTHAMLAAKYWMQDGVEAMNKRPNSFAAKEFNQFLEREGVDTSKILKGDKEEIDNYLRKASNLAQGTYDIDQTPRWINTTAGRFLWKYHKFVSQVSRIYVRQVVNPMIKNLREANSTEERAKAIVPMLRYMVATTGAGVIVAGTNSALFDVASKVLSAAALARIEDKEGFPEFMMYVADSFMQAQIASGGLGILGNLWDTTKRMHEGFKKGQDATDSMFDPPPGLSLPLGVVQAVERYIRTGDVGAMKWLEQSFSAYRNTKKLVLAGAHALGVKDDEFGLGEAADRQNAKMVKSWVNNHISDYLAETGKISSTPSTPPSPNTPRNEAIADQLMVGNSAVAKELVKEAIKEGGENTRSSITTSIKLRHPLSVGKSTNDKEREAFLKWLRGRTSYDEYTKVTNLVTTYEDAAIAARAMNGSQKTNIPAYDGGQ